MPQYINLKKKKIIHNVSSLICNMHNYFVNEIHEISIPYKYFFHNPYTIIFIHTEHIGYIVLHLNSHKIFKVLK